MGFDFGARKDFARLEDEAAAEGRLGRVVGEMENDIMGPVERSAGIDPVGVVQRFRDVRKDQRAELDCFPLGTSLDWRRERTLFHLRVTKTLGSAQLLVISPSLLLWTKR